MMLTRYKDVEDFLFRQLPMFQRVGPKAFKKDLSNINSLMELLNHPHRSFKSIHIAGTNGKGSTSFLLAAALHGHGHKVGLYTSPHYKDYRERIKMDGDMIPKAYVKRFVNRLIALRVFDDKLKPSFFEITVAMAFCYFEEQKVDYAVIETGLGGRLDSTNVIIPILSIITNIGLDHTQFLGETLELIAREKAGIMKNKVPVVIGRHQSETKEVFAQVSNKNDAPLFYVDNKVPKQLNRYFQSLATYQKENAFTALTALKQLDLPIDKSRLEGVWTEGLNDWGYMGRYQILDSRPKIIADSAHNPMGIKNLFDQVASEEYDQLHIIIAVVADKDLTKVLPLLPADAHYYCSAAKIPRAMPAAHLHKELNQNFNQVRCYGSVRKALAAVRKRASESDLILVTGSVFTVAEVV